MSSNSSSESETNLAKAKAILSTVASVAAAVTLARSVASDLLPPTIRDKMFFSLPSYIVNYFSSDMTIIIDQYEGPVSNQLYEEAKIYLGSILDSSTTRIRVNRPEKEESLRISMEKNQSVVDIYTGVKMAWDFNCVTVQTGRDKVQEKRSFVLTFPKKSKDMVLSSYFQYLAAQAKSIQAENRTLKLHTVQRDPYSHSSVEWISVTLDHPSTFATLALDLEIKNNLMEDLNRFIQRRDFYRRVGKAWKRGYLLYGPPGTGKSSLIAAMANHLKFDIYDLELTAVMSNSDLRMLLVNTANKSIIVVEDIDCTIEFKDRTNENDDQDSDSKSDRKEKVTLSGFLNFIDGLWSSCGDERIIIFTTNHKEKLDPALIRPGRMDMHVHMSYCTPSAFRVLAANYLSIKDHKLFVEIEEAIQTTEVTPAEVAEQLMRYNDDVDAVLKGFIEFFKAKKLENEEAKKAENTMKKIVTVIPEGKTAN